MYLSYVIIIFVIDGYTTKEIMFRWRDIPHPIQVDPGIEIPEFYIDDVTHGDCTQTYVTGEIYVAMVTGHYKNKW